MSFKSPFAQNRYEFESMHLFFLQEHLFRRLEARKPAFLIGARGTGKTTLLKSLSWRERVDNLYLQRQLNNEPFSDRCIGIYLKLPEIQISCITWWLRDQPQPLKTNLYSYYLELVYLQEMFTAVSTLASRGYLRFTASNEHESTNRICETMSGVTDLVSASIGRPKTLLELSKAVHDARWYIENGALCGSDPTDIARTLKLSGQLISTSKEVMHELKELCTLQSNQRNWLFKVCFDEGESLDEIGRLVMNTWMRLAADPLHIVVSYVSRPENLSETLLPNLTLQQADRDLVDLDQMTDKEFTEFAEGVAGVRVNVALGVIDSPPRLNIESILGKLNINQLLNRMLSESANEKARKLLADAKLAHLDQSQSKPTRREVRSGYHDQPPIFQTYLSQKLNLEQSSADKPSWLKRKMESQDWRKKMVAAYLSICDEFGIDIRYSSADMLLQMSDRCIRDFLVMMDHMLIESKVSLEDFISVATPLPWIIQNSALKKASQAKYQSIPRSAINVPTPTARLVEGLAILTAVMQSTSSTLEHLRTPERGRFLLKMQDISDDKQTPVLALIRDAAEAGFLRILRWAHDDWRFQVHASLAAAYGFSYRGAYYTYPISYYDLSKLISADSPAQVFRIAKDLCATGNIGTAPSLFPDEA